MSVFKVGKTGTPSKAYPIFSRIKGLRRCLGMLSSLKRFSGSEVASERLRILNFYSKHGELATKEFLYPNLHLIHDKITFNRELAKFIIFYNTKRPHKSLGLKSPMDYLITKGLMSKKTVSHAT